MRGTVPDIEAATQCYFNDSTIAWFKDPAGNILSVLEATM